MKHNTIIVFTIFLALIALSFSLNITNAQAALGLNGFTRNIQEIGTNFRANISDLFQNLIQGLPFIGGKEKTEQLTPPPDSFRTTEKSRCSILWLRPAAANPKTSG